MNQPLQDALDFFAKLPQSVHYAAQANTLVLQECSKQDYDAYVERLLAAGHTLAAAHSIGENYHATLRGDGHMMHVYFNACRSAVRAVYDENTVLPCFSPQPCAAKQATVLYQFETDHTLIDCGMCYIIQCADGSFFIIDSAHYYSFNDNDRIHKFLRERTPAGEDIIIAGWYFSHSHVDHVGKFMDFLRYNCDDVVIEALYFNFVPSAYFDDISAEDQTVKDNFFRLVRSYPDLPKITLHTGQQFYARNLSFEVLYTHEDVYPSAFRDYNTSSSVLMLTADGTKILFPGDAGGVASKVMIGRYGDYLKCDILQVAHHGHYGLSPEFYQLAHAPVVMFPTTQIKYDEEFAVFEANRTAAALSEQCYIASNGTIAIPLPFTGDVQFLGDETFEDFDKIKGLWGYDYTDARKQELYAAFLARGGRSNTLFQR